jgi:hypothetical protein
MTRGLEHTTPLRVYLRSLEDTSARTAHVRGQGHAWKGCSVPIVFPASLVSGLGLAEGLLGAAVIAIAPGEAPQVDPSFKTIQHFGDLRRCRR